MSVIDIRNIPKKTKDVVTFKDDRYPILYIDYQKTGFGYKRFFICPKCGARRERLYSNSYFFSCRSCLKVSPYRGIQNTTRGGEVYISYKMYRIASKYGITIKYPFTYFQLLLNKPKHMHNKTWLRVGVQLQILENMRNQAIFFNRFYNAELIEYVLKNCLYEYSLPEIEKYLLDWDNIARCHKKGMRRYVHNG